MEKQSAPILAAAIVQNYDPLLASYNVALGMKTGYFGYFITKGGVRYELVWSDIAYRDNMKIFVPYDNLEILNESLKLVLFG